MRAFKWMPEPEWLVVHFVAPHGGGARSGNAKTDGAGLLQEREITYRNLLAAYLKLQEVIPAEDRCFLASACARMRRRWRVIKRILRPAADGFIGGGLPISSGIF